MSGDPAVDSTLGGPQRSGPLPGDGRALLSIAIQFFVNGVVFASFIPRLPEIRDRIDVSTSTMGGLLAVGGAAGLLGSAVVGRAIERFGSRRVLVGGAVVLVGALGILGLAVTPVVFLAGLMVLSSMDVFVDASMNLQGSWVSGRRRVPVMNRLHGVWSLGTVVGGVVAARAASAGVSLQVHLLVASAVTLVVVGFVGTGLIRDDRVGGGDATATTATTTEAVPTVDTDGEPDPVRAMDGRRRSPLGPLVLLGLASACAIMMEMTSTDWSAFRLRDDLDAAPGVAGLGFVAFTVGMTVGRFGGDSLIARFGQQRIFRVSILVTIVSLVAISFATTTGLVVAAYGVAGAGVATQFPKLYDDAARHPGRRGAGLGALTAGSRVALLITPALVGALAGTSLSVGAATAVVTLPAAVAFFVIGRR